jgi:hypothetical protein
VCDIAYVLLLERMARLDPFSGSDPAELLDEQLMAESKRIDPEKAELMDALGVSR